MDIVSSGSPVAAPAASQLRFSTIAALGQFAFPLAIVYLPLNLYLTRFYGGDLKIDIAVMGLVLMIARLADFFLDPLIGAFADRYGHSYGRRRLWTAIAVPIMMIGVYLTFLPPANAGPVYLLLAVTLVYLGWTMGTIAYGAWGAEASADYKERTHITGVREMFGFIGILVASLAPFYSGGGAGSAAGFGPVMATLGWMAIVLLPLSTALMIWLVPEPKTVASELVSWRRGLQVAARNGPFMRLLATNFVGRIGTAANLAAVFWFFEKGLDLGLAAGIPVIIYLITAVAGAPLWIWAGHRIAKHNALIIGSLGGIAVFSILFFVPQHQLVLTTAIMAVAGISGSAAAVLGASIAADVIDLDAMRSREARAGLLLAFWGMAQKGADALGVGLGMFVLSAFSFNANGANDAHAILGLKIVYIAMPMVFWLLSAIFIWRFPITPERHARIRAVLERRAKREAMKRA